ncbi:unnamed protein product [Moneuplotes crassus]|uniref:Uncharacterized protein n=1 Tax=Euplotes crassus TaxID=5936 RepID=A0AAD1XPR8_EUPCR|nr:unnamed protein product [Moneuplotes crassus]
MDRKKTFKKQRALKKEVEERVLKKEGMHENKVVKTFGVLDIDQVFLSGCIPNDLRLMKVFIRDSMRIPKCKTKVILYIGFYRYYKVFSRFISKCCSMALDQFALKLPGQVFYSSRTIPIDLRIITRIANLVTKEFQLSMVKLPFRSFHKLLFSFRHLESVTFDCCSFSLNNERARPKLRVPSEKACIIQSKLKKIIFEDCYFDDQTLATRSNNGWYYTNSYSTQQQLFCRTLSCIMDSPVSSSLKTIFYKSFCTIVPELPDEISLKFPKVTFRVSRKGFILEL